jgi:hypothetical protein
MRNLLAYLLPLVCLASWACSGNGLHERRDAASDAAATRLPDSAQQSAPDVAAVARDAADAPTIADGAPADVADAWRSDGDVLGADAVDVRAPDAGTVTPDAMAVLDANGERGGNDAAIDKGGLDARGDAPEVGGEVRSDPADAGTEVATADAGEPEIRREVGPDGAVQCNALLPDGPLHEVVAVDGPSPVGVGGKLEDGFYYESSAQIFGSAGGNLDLGQERRLSMMIEGLRLEAAYSSSITDGIRWETDQLSMSSTDPTAFAITQLCPGTSVLSPLTFHYSFVGTGPGATFTIIYPSELTGTGETLVLTLTKQ